MEIVSLFCCNCWIYLSEYFTKLQVVNFTSITSSNSSTSKTVVSLLSSPYMELVLNNGTRPPLSKISENYRRNYFLLHRKVSRISTKNFFIFHFPRLDSFVSGVLSVTDRRMITITLRNKFYKYQTWLTMTWLLMWICLFCMLQLQLVFLPGDTGPPRQLPITHIKSKVWTAISVCYCVCVP